MISWRVLRFCFCVILMGCAARAQVDRGIGIPAIEVPEAAHGGVPVIDSQVDSSNGNCSGAKPCALEHPSTSTDARIIAKERAVGEKLIDSAIVQFDSNNEGHYEKAHFSEFVQKHNLLRDNSSPAKVVIRPLIDSDAESPTGIKQARARAEILKHDLVAQGFDESRVDVLEPSRRPARSAIATVRNVEIELHPSGSSYHWNVWLTRNGGTPLPPAKFLAVDQQYTATVDLSTLGYTIDGIDTVTVREQFSKLIKEKTAAGLDEIVLDVVLVADQRYFTNAARVLDPIKLDLRRFRVRNREDRRLDVSALYVALNKADVPDFVLHRIQFELRTRAAHGWASFGLSLWHEGRPFDELVFRRCVGGIGACKADVAQSRTLSGGSNLFDVSLDQVTKRPDAALHFMQLSNDRIVGIFVDGAGREDVGINGEYVWDIRLNPKDFFARLAELQESFGKAKDSPASVGRALTNLFFPRTDEGRTARRALQKFLNRYEDLDLLSEHRPILFVRFLSQTEGEDPLFPIGLLNFGDDEAFLGYRTEIHTPLSMQIYRSEACPNSWQMVLPIHDASKELTDARKPVSGRFNPIDSVPKFRVAESSIPIFATMKEFVGWIGPRFDSIEDLEGLPASVLGVISHHGKNSLYFHERDPADALNITARFRGHSIAILAGCTTGTPGAGGVVDTLTEAGFRTIIATNTGVEPILAGTFLERLVSSIEEADETIPIRVVFNRVQRELAIGSENPEKRNAYGPRVLSFSLAGNPYAQVCLPGRSM